MSKAFTKETDADDDDELSLPPLPAGGKNYITPEGYARLKAEIDRRIRFLTKRLEIAEISDPAVHHGSDQVFFGATVTYIDSSGSGQTVTILGIDEADSARNQVSWISPIARALLKARVGDEVKLATPGGLKDIEVVQVSYPTPEAAGGPR